MRRRRENFIIKNFEIITGSDKIIARKDFSMSENYKLSEVVETVKDIFILGLQREL